MTATAHAGNVTYVYTDQQGTPIAEADATGIITARFDYAPYGAASTASGMTGAPNGPGYTGHVNDPESGFVYMQARYYDPAIGRFMSIDPVTPAAGNAFNFNRYMYTNNNPILNIDPNGRDPQQTEAAATELAKKLNDNGSGVSTGFWSVVRTGKGPNGYTIQTSEQNAMEKAHLTQQAELGYQPGAACPEQCAAGAIVIALSVGDVSKDPNAEANNSAKDATENLSKALELLEKAPNKSVSEFASGFKIAPPVLKLIFAAPAARNNYLKCMQECPKSYMDRPSTKDKEGQQ